MSTAKKQKRTNENASVDALQRANNHFAKLLNHKTGAGRLPLVDNNFGCDKIMSMLLSHFIPYEVTVTDQSQYMNTDVLCEHVKIVQDATLKVRAVMPVIFTDDEIVEMERMGRMLESLDKFTRCMSAQEFVNMCAPTADPTMQTVVMSNMSALKGMAASIMTMPVDMTGRHTHVIVREAASKTMLSMSKICNGYTYTHQEYAAVLINDLIRMADATVSVSVTDEGAMIVAGDRRYVILCKRKKIKVGRSLHHKYTRFYSNLKRGWVPCMNGAQCVGATSDKIKRDRAGKEKAVPHDKCLVAFRTPDEINDPNSQAKSNLCIRCILSMFNNILGAARLTRTDVLLLVICGIEFVTEGDDAFPVEKMHKLRSGTDGGAFHGVDGALLVENEDDYIYNDGSMDGDPGTDWNPQLNSNFR